MANAFVLLLAHPIIPIVHMILMQIGDLTVVMSTVCEFFGVDLPGWAHSSVADGVDGDLIARRLDQYDAESAWAAQQSGTAEIQWGAVIGQWAGGLIFTIVISICVAYFYKSQVSDRRDTFPQVVPQEYSLAGKDWKYGTFSCFDDCTYCMYGSFCGGCRTADSYQAMGIGGFWKYIGAFLAMHIFGQVTNLGFLVLVSVAESDANVGQAGNFLSFIAALVLAAWLASERQVLRRKLGDTQQGTMCMDFISYFCCGCCTYIQDARQVDGASGTTIECFCKLVKRPHQTAGSQVVVGTVVGEPVGMMK